METTRLTNDTEGIQVDELLCSLESATQQVPAVAEGITVIELDLATRVPSYLCLDACYILLYLCVAAE